MPRSCRRQAAARSLEVGRRVDAERGVVDARAGDPHAGLQRAQLFQASPGAPAASPAARRSAPARRGGRRRCRYGASAGRRPRGSARARSRAPAHRAAAVERAGGLHHRGQRRLLLRIDRRDQRRDIEAGIRERRQHGAQIRRRDARQVALQVHHHVVPALRIERPPAPRARGRSRAAAPDRSAPRCRRRRAPPRRSRRRRRRPRPGRSPPRAPRSSTCTIIGRPWMSASGLPGSRVEAMRAGMTTIGFTGARRDGLMGKVVSLWCAHLMEAHGRAQRLGRRASARA